MNIYHKYNEWRHNYVKRKHNFTIKLENTFLVILMLAIVRDFKNTSYIIYQLDNIAVYITLIMKNIVEIKWLEILIN